jgi:hypothetical protein
MMDKRAWLFLLPLIFSPQVFVSAQDCCAPGGGLTARIAAEADVENHFTFPRRYKIRKHHTGFDAGIEAGSRKPADNTIVDLTSHLEYNGFLKDLDIYGAVFYTASFDKPAGHQLDVTENIGYTLNLSGVSALIFRLDNEDMVTLSPGDPAFVYGAAEPSVVYGKQFDFGGLSAEIGLPLVYKPDFRLGSYATLGYEHSSGFKAGISASLAIIPDAAYSGTALTVTYVHEWFYITAAFSADKDLNIYGIRPYAEFFISRFTLWAGADISGLGGETFAISPFVGAKYNF